MKPRAQELKHALQLLALPVTAQMRLNVGDRDRVRTLAHEYQYWYRAVCCQAAAKLTSRQTTVLEALDKLLTQASLGNRPPVWSDVDMRRCAVWRQVRRTAREALVTLNWSLELPSPDAGIYEALRGEITHGQWTLCRQTRGVSDSGVKSCTPLLVVHDFSSHDFR